MTSEICKLLAERIPHPVTAKARALAHANIADVPADLIPTTATPDRQREFAAGRLAATATLTELGVNEYFPAVGESRQPVWPNGIVGSISHDDEFAVAICSRSLKGVGLDIERLTHLDIEERSQFMTAKEQSDPEWGDPIGAIRLFSYKEAIFKCIYPLTGEFLDFTDVEICDTTDSLQAHCTDPENPASEQISEITGFIEQLSDRIVSACWLSHRLKA